MIVCGDFYPGYRELLSSWLAHPSVEVKGFRPTPAHSSARATCSLSPRSRKVARS